MSKIKVENNDNFELCLKFYEKAIEGRNLHYQNYNTWAHYYAIFTGALFIAYYTVKTNNSLDLAPFISIIGLITSICWHLTVKGHYHWMLSWIKIVHDYENELAKISNNEHQKEYRIYSVYLESQEDVYQENISSQKLTSLFTIFIEFAWMGIIFLELYSLLNKIKLVCYSKLECYILSFLLVVLIYVFGNLIFSKKTDINDMKRSIY